MIVSHLISLGKKESKVTTQILHIQTILNAFGHCSTNQSKFGKYMELQFNERGRMIGCKILNYLLDKRRVLTTTRNNFNIFNIVNSNLTEENESLKVSLRHLGLGKRYLTRITQLILTLTQLTQLQFIDDTTMQQEGAYVKNVELLEIIADALGLDTRALENVLTYKTQLIKKDVTTLILNAEQASIQRDDLIVTLYSLLFNWIIEHINQKLCNDNIHNFIGILDLPATEIQPQQQQNFDKFCLNYTNERVQNHIQKYLFETINSEYQLDGFNLDLPTYNNSCIDLFDQPRNGFIDIINSYSKKSTSKVSDNTMIETTFKYQNGNDSFQLKKADTGSNYFVIQHFNGFQSYQQNGFIEANRDPLNIDFINLFKGSSDTPSSSNTFIVNLFADKSITTESHPKFNDSILNAQQLNKPNRAPSMRRSKSTKKNRNSTVTDQQQQQQQEKNSKKIIPVVLSQLRSSLDELFSTLDETMPWFVFCLKASKNNNSSITFDSNLVRTQLESFNLISIASTLKLGSYGNIFLHSEFVDRYRDILSSINIDPDRLPKDKCQTAIDILGWSTTMDAAIGHTKVKREREKYFVVIMYF